MTYRPMRVRFGARTTAVLASATSVLGVALAAPAAADQQTTVSVNDVTVTEGDSGTTTAVFTVSLTQPSPLRTTVAYSTADSTARTPGDYASAAGQLVFAPGTTSKTVALDVVGDTRYEGDEAFRLDVSSPSGAIVPDGTGLATILDDDARPYLSVGDTSVVEGDSGTVNASFPITLDHASPNAVRVRYETATGTANGADYQYSKGTITLAAGQTSAAVDVPVTGDTLDEGNSEYFRLNLSAPSGALIFGTSGVATIFDDDSTPLMSITDTGIAEGNSGTTNMTFKVTLSNASPNSVTVYYYTSDGTATVAGNDYTAKYGTLIFSPGQVSKQVAVPVKGDTADEGTVEYMSLNLQSASGATVSDGNAYGEIVDDDPTLSAASYLTVDTATAKEGNTGNTTATFKVLLQPASASTVTVNYATSGSSATAGVDYTTTNGTLTIPAGTTSVNVTVPVRGDNLIEGDEQFFLNLSGAINATIDDSSAAGVIVDDDVAPVASISDTTVVEGDTGTGDAAFEISLSSASPVTVSVVYTTNNSSAQAPGDYTTITGTAVFQPGEVNKVVHVATIGDTIDENDEQFYVYLSSPSNATVTDNYGYAVIVNDDRSPTVSVDDISVYEGTTGSVQPAFTVTMDAPSANTVTVNYATSNGSAVAPDDYTAVSGTLTFAPGETSKTVPVTVESDTLDENTEYVNLTLSSPVNATVQDNSGDLRILDDDTRPGISVDDVSISEPDTGTAAVTFHVSLSAASANVVTVNYATANGSATAPGDYTSVSNTLTFNPGETVKPVQVLVAGDTLHENSEYLTLNLGAPTMASVLDSTGYATVFDQDPLPYLTVDETGLVEGNSGSKNGTFTVSLQPASSNTVTVAYTTADGTATTAGGDYVATSGALTFAPGETSKTVTAAVNGDTVDENNEYFALNLSAPTNAAVLDGTGYVTIFDNDPSGSGSIVSINDATVLETDSGTANATFTVTLSPAATSQVTVNYNTSNGSALGDADFVPQTDTLAFAPGQTSATVTVPVKGDTFDEGEERFSLSLFSLTGGASFGESSASGVILDNDHSPVITIGDVTVNEGNTGTVDAAFPVQLTEASPQPVYVDWDTRDGSAVAPGDYLDDGGTLTFTPGQTVKTVHITVNGDDLIEGDQVFHVDLSGLVGASYATSQSTGDGTILDSDAYAVLGSVTNAAGTGVNGTRVTLSGNSLPNAVATTASGGLFAFDDVPDGQYTLTPSATNRVFAPGSYTVNVRGGSLTGFTFLSLIKPSVSGRVVDAAGNPVAGVTVTRTGNSQPNATATTNGMGYYGFAQNPVGTYTIKPTKAGSTFTPVRKSVTLTATSAITANFTKN
jgi:large repetitive protein